MSHQQHQSKNPRSSGYYSRGRRQYGRQNGQARNNASYPGRYRAELPPLIPIPQHRRTYSTNSNLSSSSSSSQASSLSSRFSSHDDQQRYIDSFEATLAYDNPFNQSSASAPNNNSMSVSFEESPQPFYHYPPPPSKTLRLIQQIRKFDVEKLKTLKTVSLDALMNDNDEEVWLSQVSVDVFRYQTQPTEDYFLEEPFDAGASTSGSSADEDCGDNVDFHHHINSLLDLISS